MAESLAERLKRMARPWYITHRAPFAVYWKVRGGLSRGWRRQYAEWMLSCLTEHKWNKEIRKLDDQLRERPEMLKEAPVRRWHFDFLLCKGFLGTHVNEDYIRKTQCHMTWAERRGMVTHDRLHFLKDYLNEAETVALCDDKFRAAEHWKDWYGRACVEACAAHPVDAATLRAVMNGKNRLIVKPVTDYGGKGIRVPTLETEADIEAEAARLNASEELQIVEEYVQQTGLLHELNPASLNTVRVITGRHADGRVDVLNTYLRLGGEDSVVDNVSSGGCMFIVDRDTGIVGRGKRFGTMWETHPDTGRRITGLQLPHWKEAMDFCRSAHRHAPEGLWLAGWDVCISDDRLTIIEVNACPGFNAPNTGYADHWKRVSELLDDKERRGKKG